MSEYNLATKIGSVELDNPTLLAAGVLGLTGSTLKKVWNSGAGGVVTKSVGPEPRKGYPGPNVVETSCGLLNAMGLPNPGIDEMLEEIEITRGGGVKIVGSIFGETPEEIAELARKMEDAKVTAVELNLSCPHAEKVSTIGQDPASTSEMVGAVRDEVNIPIWAKLPGNTHIENLLRVAEAAEEAGADAIVQTNTVPGMAIDSKARRPILGNEKGGLSGPAIKPIGLRLVHEVYEKVEVPIIGVGGVLNGEDMIEYILAGASAVEIGTGIIWRDMEIFSKINEEASERLEGEEIGELIGAAHRD